MTLSNEFSLLQNVNWEYLKRFKICAESKNFKEAAQIIGTTPNTIVTQLDALEESLGFTLFERTQQNRTHKLTFQGERLLQLISRAALYLSGLHPVEDNPVQENSKQKIKIVTTPGLASSLLPEIIDTFLKHHSNYQFEVLIWGSAVKIQNEEIIIRSDIQNQPDIIKEPLGEVAMNLYASPEYIQKMGKPNNLEDLKHHKVFIFNSFTYGNTNWALLPEKGFPILAEIFSNSIDLLYEMCVKGYGILEVAHIYKNTSHLVHVLENVESPKDMIYMGFHKSNLSNPHLFKFINFTLENFQNKFNQK